MPLRILLLLPILVLLGSSVLQAQEPVIPDLTRPVIDELVNLGVPPPKIRSEEPAAVDPEELPSDLAVFLFLLFFLIVIVTSLLYFGEYQPLAADHSPESWADQERWRQNSEPGGVISTSSSATDPGGCSGRGGSFGGGGASASW